MVHDPEVGAIVVGSPTPFHAEQIIEAAKLGKHVFCEKVGEKVRHDVGVLRFSYSIQGDFNEGRLHVLFIWILRYISQNMTT